MSQFAVIIPCFRQAHLLPTAVQSVLDAADGVDVEIVVVDDGSPDDVPTALGAFPEVKLVRQPNSGLSAARNSGVLASSAPLLLFLDGDDAVGRDFFKAATAAFSEHPDLDVVHGVADVVDCDGITKIGVFGGPYLDEAEPLHSLLKYNIGPPNTFVVRRTVLSRAGLFEPSLPSCEDWDLWLRIAAAGGRFRHAPTMRGVYRSSPGSMSKNVERMWRAGRTVLWRNSTWHFRCSTCEKAASVGRNNLAVGLWPLVRDGLCDSTRRRLTLATLVRNPNLAWHQLRRRAIA